MMMSLEQACSAKANFSREDSIAIVGMGCRFPGGVNSPASFWELLKKGADGIIEVPPDRWNIDRFYDANPATPGKMYVRAGGFLKEKIDEFDALFFGISPREAGFIDPQQRILMEVAWEALEDAGIDPEKLAGSDTGVYVGGFMLDNLLTQFSPLNRDQIGSHSAVGSTLTILSNRLSYVFDLRGPSITLDTACSSSLVALHEACQSIWRGECTLALCGGVNIMHRPENPIAMCKGGFLSPDGRSKSFDKRANGYGRGEGAGTVVLKPYSAAVQDGDTIYALIRGTGANQDGRTDGITVPNPEAQEALMRKVCVQTQIDPRDIYYVEAHGTGTPLGDPLEARAIAAVFGQDRPADNPCWLGSVKANIGHLEAASGVAGLIKLALCLHHRAVPPLANLVEPNPNIPFAELGLRLPLALHDLPQTDRSIYMGINSFGYGGTNAHALLEEYKPDRVVDPSPTTVEAAPGFQILTLSARSKGALSALANRYLDRLQGLEAPEIRDLCYSAALRRGHYDQRVALVANSREALAAQLQSYIKQESVPGVVVGTVGPKDQKPVFVMTGMGPQTSAMGRELYRHEPVFRDTAEACDRIFCSIAGWSILKEMLADEKVSRIAETQIAQPANFIIQASLAALWKSWGVEPAAVVGHSVGEVTAAYLAGVLSLEDALSVSYHRSRIQKKAAGIGTMLAVGLSEADVQPYLAGYPGQVSLAAANAPSSVTIAGDTEALTKIAAQLQAKGTFNRFLSVEVAYHSHTMEPLKEEVRDALKEVQVHPAMLPIYSTVTGDRAPTGAYDAEYWCRNVREPVYFEKAMGSLIRDGYRIFLEVGPHPVLSTSIKECLSHHGVQGALLASLRRDKPERQTMLEGLGGLYCAGGKIDWKTFYIKESKYIKLPTYPWQRDRYWSENASAIEDRTGGYPHALLGRKTKGPAPTWESTLNGNLLPYLPDHRVENLVILPGAAYAEIGLAIHQSLTDRTEVCLENLEFNKALIIGATVQPTMRSVYEPQTRRYEVFSREREGSSWNSHAFGYLSELFLGRPGCLALEEIKRRCTERVEASAHYQNMDRRGLQYGPYFQGVRELWLRPDGGEVFARIEGHPSLIDTQHHHLLHPSLLDSCFQCLLAGLGAKGDQNVYVPVKINQLRLYRSPVGAFWCHSRFTSHGDATLEGDVTLCDENGEVWAEVRGVRAQALSNKSQDEMRDIDDWFYQFSWEKLPLDGAEEVSGRWLVFCDQDKVGDDLIEQLRKRGAESVVAVRPGPAFRKTSANEFVIRKDHQNDYNTLLERTDLGSLQGVVHGWALDSAEETDIGIEKVVSALYLVQSLAYAPEGPRPRIFFLTRNAQPVEPHQAEIVLSQTSLIGFVRVAQNEFHEMRLRLIDFEPTTDYIARVVDEMVSSNREEEVSLRATGRYVNRLIRRSSHELEQAHLFPNGMGAVYSKNGHKPKRELTGRKKPGRGEVEIALSLIALDPLEAIQPLVEGIGAGSASASIYNTEAFGIVTAVGADAGVFKTGDRVMAHLCTNQGRFANAAIDDVYLSKTTRESGVDPTQTTCFATAYYALNRLAHLQPGDHLLIHAAANPIGLAAIEIARWRGATIYATAQTVEQRAYLSSLGLPYVFDSRSFEFVDEIRLLTEGRGVDVVLNRFGGEVAAKTIELLSSFGRCVNVTTLSLQGGEVPVPFGSNQLVCHLDIYQVRKKQPEQFDKVVTEVRALLASGALRPVPTKIIFPSDSSQEVELENDPGFFGLRFVNYGEVDAADHASIEPMADRIRSDGTYLITGGFGGFGLEVAKWLVKQGAKHLVLVGRRGANTVEGRQAVQLLKASGARVLPMAADVSSEEEVDRLFTEVAKHMPVVRGLFHAAAVLDDGAIRGLFPSKFETVMKPKALGAWLLHQRSLDLPLDYFVLFSSIGSLVGNPGQAPYVAANAFLDTLAHYRASRNQPAICINWGALGQIGMAARQKGVEDYLNRMGFGSFTPSQAINVLDKLLDWKPVGVGAALMNWKVVRKSYPTWALAPRNSIVMADKGEGDGESDHHGPLHGLSQLGTEERRKQVAQIFIELVSAILRIPAERIQPTQSLLNMGMDSLMGIEIQAAIEKKMGVKVSTLELMKGSNVTELVDHLCHAVEIFVAVSQPTKTGPVASPPVHASHLRPSVEELVSANPEDVESLLETLSDEEVEQALELLSRKEK